MRHGISIIAGLSFVTKQDQAIASLAIKLLGSSGVVQADSVQKTSAKWVSEAKNQLLYLVPPLSLNYCQLLLLSQQLFGVQTVASVSA